MSELIKHEKDGIGFYTQQNSGDSGMSHSGLARFVGVSSQTIDIMLQKLAVSTPDQVKYDVLKPFAGQNVYLSTDNNYNAKVIRDDVCAAIVEYYAFDTKNKTATALYAYRKFASIGIRQMIQRVTKWHNPIHDPLVREIPKQIAEYYVSSQFLPWSKKFPDMFFEELYRLRGWDYELRAENKPFVVGRYINDLVYSRLPVGVLELLKDSNPMCDKGYRPKRHHQLIADGQGQAHLDKQIMTVVSLLKASDSWEQFTSMLEKVTPKQSSDDLVAPLT